MSNSIGSVSARPGFVVATVIILLGVFMSAGGFWALLAPAGFAKFAQYALSEHFVKDGGAFKVGIGATLFLSLIVRDSVIVALGGFLVSNSLHAVNHATDLHLGGFESAFWVLAGTSAVTAIALFIHLRARSRNSE